MILVLQVALGVIIAFVVLAHWRRVLTVASKVILAVAVLALLGFGAVIASNHQKAASDVLAGLIIMVGIVVVIGNLATAMNWMKSLVGRTRRS